jgi:class 3 adenylate cyclase/predicted ATPase
MTALVQEWLEGLGLGKYTKVFAENDIGADVLPVLTEDHLKELGVSLGDRLRLLKAIAVLTPAQPDSPQSASVMPPTGVAVETTSTPPAARESERRQLTVMFCDLVGSTALSTRFDPEDMQEILRAYHDLCANVVADHHGYVAQYMGDGVLVYFGYPQARGNEAERAARAGLSIVAALAQRGLARTLPNNLELAVRVGINTGLVVVGDILGQGASREASVFGETPNLAARLQTLAQPNQVMVGPLTHQLIADAFACEDLGEHQLKGIAGPVRAWRVLHEDDIHSSQDSSLDGGGMPLVGRQEELGLLLRSWEVSKGGHGQVVLIQGDAGIGKSRLIRALRERVAGDEYLWVAIRCSASHTNSALYPVIEHLKRAMSWKPEDDAETRLEKLETALRRQSMAAAEAVPLLAELMSLPLPQNRYASLDLSAKQKRDQTLDTLAGWLLEEAERRPVLQIWEDLHWADPTTLELLTLYVEQSPTVSMMNVLTYRPDFLLPGSMRSHMTPITLSRLERPEVEAIIVHQAGGKAVPAEVVRHIVNKADGVPLYVEELTKTILESEYLSEETDRYTLTGSLADLSIPATLQDTLMARLDRLPRVRELAQLGAVLGREFAFEMLQALVEMAEPHLREGLDELVGAELLYQRGRAPRAKYVFKHALIQDAAYASLLKRTRQQYHQQVARLLEARFPETVETHPEIVAHHYTEAGNSERAVHYWRLAGERARAQSANVEAIAYLDKGIAMLRLLPDNEERAKQELALQASLGHANIVAKGHGAAGAEAAYSRALELCEQQGNVPELAPTLFGLWRFFVVARPLDQTNKIAVRLLELATERESAEMHVIARYALGYTALCMGKLADASMNLEAGITRYRVEQREAAIYRTAQDPWVACQAYLGMTEWLRGYPDKARARIADSAARAEEISDSFSLAYALCFPGAIVAEECGSEVDSRIERGLEVASHRGFALWVAFAEVHRANLRLQMEKSSSALDELRARVFAIPQLGVHINTPYYMTLLVRAYLNAGQVADGLQVLDGAQASIDARGEHWWAAEVQRLRGDLLLARSPMDEHAAEQCLHQAIAIAREQGTKSLELRAAMSLARYWQSRDKRDDARTLLDTCYQAFAEGFQTADLRAAQALLATLQ